MLFIVFFVCLGFVKSQRDKIGSTGGLQIETTDVQETKRKKALLIRKENLLLAEQKRLKNEENKARKEQEEVLMEDDLDGGNEEIYEKEEIVNTE